MDSIFHEAGDLPGLYGDPDTAEIQILRQVLGIEELTGFSVFLLDRCFC